MEKIKKFFVENKTDIFIVCCFTILFFTFFFLLKDYLGDLIFDNGREAYIPIQVLKGKILYKDIFDNYGPLSYQINALLYFIFGIHLNTLYFAGAIISIIILTCTFFITRIFTTKSISYLTTLFILCACVFKTGSIFNFIFPYSYGMLYALATFLLSVLFLLYYLKTNKQFFIPLSWFFIGISFASKHEYFLYILILGLISFFFKPVNKKVILQSIFAFLSVPFICFSILFYQGLTIVDLMKTAELIKKLSLSPSIHYFYKLNVGTFPCKGRLFDSITVFANFLPLLVSCIFSFYFSLLSIKEKYSKRFFLLSTLVFSFSSFLLFNFVYFHTELIFSLAPILCSLVLLLFIFKNLNQIGGFFKDITTGKLLIITAIIALSASIKGFFFLTLRAYGTFFLPLLFVVIIIFITEYFPEFFVFIKKGLWEKTICFLLLIGSFLYIRLYFNNTNFYYQKPITINNDTFYISRPFTVKSSLEAINYIDSNTKPNDKITIFPEGLMYNYLTKRDTDNFYYTALMPPNLDMFGEENIIKYFNKNKPDYIVIHTFNMLMFDNNLLCYNSAMDFCSWIYKNYSKEKVFDNDGFKITIYKLNSP